MAVRFYFRKIDVIGNEYVPKKGAAILIVNHPSALLDPLVVAVLAGRQLHFVAAAEYFGSKLTTWLFKKQFNMIPVYRPDINKSGNGGNEHMFQHCFEALANGGVIIIFPEGNSETEKRLRKLKTGVVRMAIGAEKQNGVSVPIIPIGLNYTNPHRFQSDVFVSIGEPVYLEAGVVSDDKEAVVRQTSVFEEKLKQQVIHIEDERLESTIQRVEQIFTKWLQQDLGISNIELQRRFLVAKDVIKAVAYFESKTPDAAKLVYDKMDKYYGIIEELPMHGKLLNHVHSESGVLKYAGIIFLFPVFLLGFIINIVPFHISGIFFKKKFLNRIKSIEGERLIRPVMSGSIAFGLGTVFFIVWYLLLGVGTMIIYTWWMGIVLLPVSYWLGLFSLRYLGVLRNLREESKLKSVKQKYPTKMEELLLLRDEIIVDLKQFADEYLKLPIGNDKLPD
jgi:1-acyl-sn-glycerol-3-phosphate acyltransferase